MGIRVQGEPYDDSKREEAVHQLRQSVNDFLEAHPFLKEWCTDTTLRRYLNARNWNVANSTKMLQNTLEWRRTYKPHEITWESVAEEATGKEFVMPCTDKEGRTIVIMRPREEKSHSAKQQIRFLVYTLEIASRRADASGQGKMTWLIDFEGYSMRNAPSIRVSISTLSILQGHYPERLGLAVCYHPPRLFTYSWKALQPFIDPVTAKKVVFIRKDNEAAVMTEKFDMEKMEACLGGKGTWTYNRDDYGRSCKLMEGTSACPAISTKNGV